MFKRVDIEGEEKFEGFSYINNIGDEEFVVVSSVSIIVRDGNGEEVLIYPQDISKLIKALQAAKTYLGVA